jgi:Tfp pilus assembly protein PilO
VPALPRLPDFQKLPFRLQVAVVAGVLALVGVGGYAGLVAPKNREIKTLKAQLLREEQAILVPRQPLPPVPPITEEERKLWAQLEARLRERFPSEKSLPGALEAVAELARSVGMELTAINLQTPSVKAATGTAAPTPPPIRVPPPLALSPTLIRLGAVHRYRDLIQFLDGLDRLPVAVAVESLEVKREENRLRTEMTLRTLRWGT